MKIENCLTLKNGRKIAFDRVTTSRLYDGVPAYNLGNGHTVEFQPNKYWEDTRTHFICAPIVNKFTGEVYGFLPKTTDLPATITVNSKYKEV